MAETNVAEAAYSNILEITSLLITEKAIPWIAKRLLAELNEYVKRFKEECSGGRCVDRQRHHRPTANCHRDFEAVMELFRQRRMERKQFRRVFPRWKDNREDVIRLLNRSAQELHEQRAQLDRVNTAASILSLSGGIGTFGLVRMDHVSGNLKNGV